MFREKVVNKVILLVAMSLVAVLLVAACQSQPQAPQPLPTAAIKVTTVSATPAEVKVGEKVTIKAEVVNTGGSKGSYTAELKINDAIEASMEMTLEAKASSQAVFTISKNTTGTYKVSVGGSTAQFVVAAPLPAPPPVSTTRTWVLTDAQVSQIATEFASRPIKIHFLSGNKMTIEYTGTVVATDITISDGKWNMSPFPKRWYDHTNSMNALDFSEKNDGTLTWTAFPPNRDFKKYLGTDVDKLPYIVSVTTKDGEVTIVNRWP